MYILKINLQRLAMPLLKTSLIRKTTLFLAAAMLSVSAMALDPRQNLQLASQNNAEAQFNLGVMYYKGDGMPQDHSKAAEWFKKAADQGHTKSQNNLEAMYSNGEIAYPYKIASQQISEPLPIFIRSPITAESKALTASKTLIAEAEKDIKRAQAEASSEKMSADIAKGTKYQATMEELAKRGDPKAQLLMGMMYARGDGVRQDSSKAAEWYEKAANQGNSGAQTFLGLMYSEGDGVRQDSAKAAEWYEKAANQGDAFAQTYLGKMYSKGDGVRQDSAKAAEWYEKAANQGNSLAQLNLGVLYHQGEGVRQDYAKAAKWYEKAADQDDIEAQFLLAMAYLGGKGVRQDYARTAEWLEKAANQGDSRAQFFLGMLYGGGKGVRQDMNIAKEYFGKACDGGLQDGCDKYRKLNQ